MNQDKDGVIIVTGSHCRQNENSEIIINDGSPANRRNILGDEFFDE